MAEKMTQKQMYAFIAEQLADYPEVVEFCEKKVEQLSRERKPRKTDPAVIEFREQVLAALKEQDAPVAAKTLAEMLGQEKSAKTAAALRYWVEQGVAVKFAGEKAKDPMTYALA